MFDGFKLARTKYGLRITGGLAEKLERLVAEFPRIHASGKSKLFYFLPGFRFVGASCFACFARSSICIANSAFALASSNARRFTSNLSNSSSASVSYTHLRAHETGRNL